MIREIIGAVLFGLGMIVFCISVLGIFRLNYVLQRIHSQALGDTMGLCLTLVGIMVLCGWNIFTVKMLIVLVFMWIASAISTHLIGKMELRISRDARINGESSQEAPTTYEYYDGTGPCAKSEGEEAQES